MMVSSLVLIFATATVVGAPAETYAIRLAPPVQTGTVYSVSTTGHKVAKTSVGDRIVRAADYEISFEGRALVLEVDWRSWPVKIAFTVDKFEKVEAGAAIALLKAGIVIVADGKQDQPIFLRTAPWKSRYLKRFTLFTQHTNRTTLLMTTCSAPRN